MPKAVRKNIKVYRKVAEDEFRPEIVVSDFESFAALYGLNHRLPVVSIDNMQILNRCRRYISWMASLTFRTSSSVTSIPWSSDACLAVAARISSLSPGNFRFDREPCETKVEAQPFFELFGVLKRSEEDVGWNDVTRPPHRPRSLGSFGGVPTAANDAAFVESLPRIQRRWLL